MRILVRQLDGLIRRSIGVFEFNQDEDCLIRLQVSQAPKPLPLPDQLVGKGETVLLIHLWNERLPVFSSSGADLAWARLVLHRFKYSLSLVADYLQADSQLSQVRAVGGESIILSSGLHAAGQRFVQDLGFTVMPYHSRFGHYSEFWESLYALMIIWTFNPGGLPKQSILHLSRSEMWMGREAFLQRFLMDPQANHSVDRS